MATVTGVTKQYADAIDNQIISAASRSGTSLVLTTKGGAIINVPNAFPKMFEMYPVGTIYMNSNPANPSTYLEGGTWARWGKGRVPVSVDELDPDFNTVEKEGGASRHTLGLTEIPQHDHGGSTGIQTEKHTHSGETTIGGHHGHLYESPTTERTGLSGGGGLSAWNTFRTNQTTGGAGEHSHLITTGQDSVDHRHAISMAGGNQPHNNMQKYITVYMWKRTG